MLREIFSQKLNTESKTVNNAIITLGDTDDSGKGRHFKSRFIQPGLAGYPGQYGNALIRKENLDKFVHTLRNKPVIINHKDNIGDDDKVGEVLNVWFNPDDGWYWCDGVITDKTAQNLIQNKKWSVSCSYDFTKYDDEGGTENNIPYDIEFLDGEFAHLAIVNNPRYERANIVFNSKGVNNFRPDQKRNERGQWVKDDALILQKKNKLVPIQIDAAEIPQFETKEDLGNWFRKIFEDLGSVTITDTGIKIDLYGGNADRESFKRRFQQEPNKAVAKAFEDIITTSIKVDEREKDENHKHDQDVYYNKLKLGTDDYDVNFFVDYLAPNNEYRYAGHSTEKIENEKSTRNTQVINHIMLTKVDNNIITDDNVDFNPKERQDMNVENWNEQDHPRDEQGKFTEKGSGYKNSMQRITDKLKELDKFDLGNWLLDKELISEKHLDEIYDDEEKLHQFIYDVFQDYDVADDVKESLFKHKNFDEEQKEYYKKANNSKEHDMALIEELKKLITKVENDKGENMVNNEKEDKRKLIDEVGGILKGKVDDEIIRTIIKKMEEASYNKSEAGTADNEKEEDKKEDEKVENKKVKNEETEEDKEKVEELKEDEKKDVENKCKNSVDNDKNGFFDKMQQIYNSSVAQPKNDEYVSRADRLKAAEDYFKV